MQRTVKRLVSGLILVTVLSMGYTFLNAQSEKSESYPAVPFPKGWREWTHVKSNLIGPKHAMYKTIGGYQHIYANKIAMAGYQTGQFPEGSILIYDFLEARETENGSTVEGPRRFTSVMVKDARRYAATGGWGFEEFRGDSETDRMIAEKAPTQCYACTQIEKRTISSSANFENNALMG